MPPKKSASLVERTVALCYVRLSLTRDETDLYSPERQRANILAECERRGWTPEWHEDVEGHKSGTKESNRPGWLALKARLGDPDVVAVVANDLSRLHRKGWRVGSLIDMLEQYGVGLVLAAPGRTLDLSGPAGKISTIMLALMDEYYAVDTSQKQLDSVRFRRSLGIIVGPIPFATVRDDDGYLLPSPYGVWLMPDGTYVEGRVDQVPPHPQAIWRGFFDAVRRCYELYAPNPGGRRTVTELLNGEGYRYKDENEQIVPFIHDDIRRILANWIEYGGAVVEGKAKNRNIKLYKPETVVLNPERAVLDVELCYRVARVIQSRSRDPKLNPDNAVRLDATIYPLSKLVYCAHCDRRNKETEGKHPRTYLTGKTGNKNESRRYRHNTERGCPSKSRSVYADLLERDFLFLLENLTVKPEVIPLMTKALEQLTKAEKTESQRASIQADIATWRQRAKNADTLFLNARITEEEWRDMLSKAEHEISRLQSQLAEGQETQIALSFTVDMITNLVDNWQEASVETRRAFAHNLFEYLVYDLDKQQITDFKLKPWAELLMQLKLSGGDPDDSGTNTEGKLTVLWCSRTGSGTYPPPAVHRCADHPARPLWGRKCA
jgi:DNA invertase Pin-like site-specific DNA recombinase